MTTLTRLRAPNFGRFNSDSTHWSHLSQTVLTLVKLCHRSSEGATALNGTVYARYTDSRVQSGTEVTR